MDSAIAERNEELEGYWTMLGCKFAQVEAVFEG